jgi:hypothetical protein
MFSKGIEKICRQKLLFKNSQKIYNKLNNLISFPKFNFSHSQDYLSMPTIDIDKYINKKEGWEKECKLMAECLHDTGILVIKDAVIL